ncbi:hypothetical protein NIES4071_26440 [Calothrix sp. NIES-4071]|nr:hypothetical protein NIES4071_26440 [Calothrix sp. NIES-4071]BAZ56966.1 hypothetical protein NIES4105_26380 [Calothrix sp. NIES-4105]
MLGGAIQITIVLIPTHVHKQLVEIYINGDNRNANINANFQEVNKKQAHVKRDKARRLYL